MATVTASAATSVSMGPTSTGASGAQAQPQHQQHQQHQQHHQHQQHQQHQHHHQQQQQLQQQHQHQQQQSKSQVMPSVQVKSERGVDESGNSRSPASVPLASNLAQPSVAVARKRGRRRQQALAEQPNGLDRVFIWDIDGSLVRSDTIADSPDSDEPSVLASVADKLNALAKRLKELTLTFCDEHLFLSELESSDQMHVDDVHSSEEPMKATVATNSTTTTTTTNSNSNKISAAAEQPGEDQHHAGDEPMKFAITATAPSNTNKVTPDQMLVDDLHHSGVGAEEPSAVASLKLNTANNTAEERYLFEVSSHEHQQQAYYQQQQQQLHHHHHHHSNHHSHAELAPQHQLEPQVHLLGHHYQQQEQQHLQQQNNYGTYAVQVADDTSFQQHQLNATTVSPDSAYASTAETMALNWPPPLDPAGNQHLASQHTQLQAASLGGANFGAAAVAAGADERYLFEAASHEHQHQAYYQHHHHHHHNHHHAHAELVQQHQLEPQVHLLGHHYQQQEQQHLQQQQQQSSYGTYNVQVPDNSFHQQHQLNPSVSPDSAYASAAAAETMALSWPPPLDPGTGQVNLGQHLGGGQHGQLQHPHHAHGHHNHHQVHHHPHHHHSSHGHLQLTSPTTASTTATTNYHNGHHYQMHHSDHSLEQHQHHQHFHNTTTTNQPAALHQAVQQQQQQPTTTHHHHLQRQQQHHQLQANHSHQHQQQNQQQQAALQQQQQQQQNHQLDSHLHTGQPTIVAGNAVAVAPPGGQHQNSARSQHHQRPDHSNQQANTPANTTTRTTTPSTTTTLRTVLNNHHKQLTHRLSVRFHRIKSVYSLNRMAASSPGGFSAGALKGPGGGGGGGMVGGESSQLFSNLHDVLIEIDRFTLDWRKRTIDCLRLISESPNCTNIIVTKLPLVVALGHLVCLGLSQFFEVDQVYSAIKVNKEACIKRIKKRFGATNRCSYIVVGGRDDVDMAKRLDLPSWPLSHSDGHLQLLQLYSALNDGFLI